MAHLTARLLGPLTVTLNDEPVTGFESDKARALFAYLVVETGRPHRREKLAGLLWPERPDRAAKGNLRHTLANLRQVLGDRTRAAGPGSPPPFLHTSRQTIQFNTESDIWVDVTTFTGLLQPESSPAQTIDRLEQAVALYRGSFLEGFSVGDSPTFEEWALLKRERLHRMAIEARQRLADRYEQRGEYERALRHAWRQVELDPWRERAHRQLMRLLALSGQRGAALAQYETCRRVLDEELEVEPAEETTKLYEQIRDGALSRGAGEQRSRGAPGSAPAASPRTDAAALPSFLQEEETVTGEGPVFVAREQELAQLERFLSLALRGEGRVAFVTGEAGSGKTALLQEFARRSQDAYAHLVVATGNCSAYTGVGDPYLPFREILQLLTGDVDAQWSAGTITAAHARRLWHTLPIAAQALVEAGPDLIDTFVPGAPLVKRSATAAPDGTPWVTRLMQLVEHKAASSGGPGTQQSALFEQCTRVLQRLARQQPLVLILDDLQWADAGSVNLLFHLGRQVADSRILIVGAYRPEEVTLGHLASPSRAGGIEREPQRHPLEPVINELRRDFGDITVDLDRAAGREFVEAYLATEPSRLGRRFREMLYRQTRGHPLFTIELLRGLQERGDLVHDAQGCWVEGPALDWKLLPTRVEAVIAERVGRLDQRLRSALRVASVEGETFTAEAVAHVQGADERETAAHLSGALGRRHRLVRAEGILRIGSRVLSRYRFRHILFQRYLYDSLDEVERAHMHEDVGSALEELYGPQDEATGIAVQLARHFEEAGMTHKAVHYLRQAGQGALWVSAYQEAVRHFTRGLGLIETLPHSLEAIEQERGLQMALGTAWTGITGTQAPEVGQAYARARELCQETGKTLQLCQVLGELSVHHYVRAEYGRARERAEEALRLARQADDPLLVALGHWYLGIILFPLGDYSGARAHLQQMISWYDPQEHHRSLVNLRGSDIGPSAMAYQACCLWCLGCPEQALKESQRALALARELKHPFSLADVLCYAGCFFNSLRGDAQAVKENAEEVIALSDEIGFQSWLVTGTFHAGEALAMMGKRREGIAKMREAIAMWQSLGVRCHSAGALTTLAQAQGEAGCVEEALETFTQALAVVRETGERFAEAELHRLRAELLLTQGDEVEAEASFRKAIEVARSQHARSWELRATVSLCRLWQKQRRTEDARRRLAEIYGWFTEGFDTPDLLEARELLEKWGHV